MLSPQPHRLLHLRLRANSQLHRLQVPRQVRLGLHRRLQAQVRLFTDKIGLSEKVLIKISILIFSSFLLVFSNII